MTALPTPLPAPSPASLPRCAVLDDFQGAALSSADWGPLRGRVDVRVLREHLADREALAAAVGDCEILVVMRERTPLDAALLDLLPRLRLVVTSGMRNASIDLAACRERGITVCGTASGSEPPAELAWALILGLVRHVTTEARAVREGGPWQSTVGGDLAGRTLGLLGLGKIGGRVAAVGRAFGMDVLAWSPNLTEERVAAHGDGVRLAKDKAELFAASDVVSLHLVLSDRTRGIVGEPELRAMRPGAYLVNTSRAGLVDGPALLRALVRGGRARRVRDGAAAGRRPPPHPAERPRPPPPGVRLRGQLRPVLRAGGGGHRGVSGGRAGPRAGRPRFLSLAPGRARGPARTASPYRSHVASPYRAPTDPYRFLTEGGTGQVEELLLGEAQFAGLGGGLAEAGDEPGAVGGGGAGDDQGAAAPAEFDEALLAQPLVAAQDGVDVDAEGVGELPGGREAFAGGGGAVGEGAADAAGDLVAERDGGGGVDAEEHGQSLPRRSTRVLSRAAAVRASGTVTANSRPSPRRTTRASPERRITPVRWVRKR